MKMDSSDPSMRDGDTVSMTIQTASIKGTVRAISWQAGWCPTGHDRCGGALIRHCQDPFMLKMFNSITGAAGTINENESEHIANKRVTRE